VVVVAEQLRRAVPGGIGTYIRGLIRGLTAIGGDTTDLTLWASRAPVGSGPDPIAALGRTLTSRLPSAALTRAWDRGLGQPPAFADVVHASSLAVPPPGPAPMSVMVHDLAWRYEPDAYPRRGRDWHEAAVARVKNRASLLMVPSQLTADDLLEAGAAAHRVAVVEEGADHLDPPDHEAAAALLAELGVRSSGPAGDAGDGSGEPGGYLLSVSTVEPRKNLPRLLEAYALARPRLPEPWPLVVVGPSGWGPALEARPNVVLAGGVPGPTLSALYAGARLLAYVPLREGWGLPAVEAMASGIPVVASPMPSTGGAACEVSPLEVEAIADALVAVAGDDALRARLVAAGRARTAGLTWENTARRHLELWERLAGRGGSAS
jgi:glycosyltransferase involved in cell wall biosynthesis